MPTRTDPSLGAPAHSTGSSVKNFIWLWPPASLCQLTVGFASKAKIVGALGRNRFRSLQNLTDDFDVVALGLFVHNAILVESANEVVIHPRRETLVEAGELHRRGDGGVALFANEAQSF